MSTRQINNNFVFFYASILSCAKKKRKASARPESRSRFFFPPQIHANEKKDKKGSESLTIIRPDRELEVEEVSHIGEIQLAGGGE